MINGFIFGDVFHTGKLPEGWTKETLVADALNGWACCICGEKAPEKFGEGMVLIGKTLGIDPMPENLNKMADEILAKP